MYSSVLFYFWYSAKNTGGEQDALMNIATQRKSYDLFVFCYNYGTYTMIAVYMLAIQCGTDFKDRVFGRNPFSVTLVAKKLVTVDLILE